jgi:hypothetical protein
VIASQRAALAACGRPTPPSAVRDRGGSTAVRYKRAELVDFAVPRTAAARYLAHEPLYRPEDGHYQYKYLPAFAPLMTPFAWMSKDIAEIAWFALLVVMAWTFVRLSIVALPDRRQSTRLLTWLTVLLTGKFLVKELAFGQFNLPVALLMLGAVMAAQRGRAGRWRSHHGTFVGHTRSSCSHGWRGRSGDRCTVSR